MGFLIFFSNSFSILFHSMYIIIIIIICKKCFITYLWLSLILKYRIVWLIIKDHFHANSCISPWIQSSLNYKGLDENLVWKQSASPKLMKDIEMWRQTHFRKWFALKTNNKWNLFFTLNRQNLIFPFIVSYYFYSFAYEKYLWLYVFM